MKSISKPSYLDMPIVNSIASVYQSNRLKDAMQFHHAAFNNFTKSKLLTAASKGILPLWPLLTRANISKYVTETQATHMGHMQNNTLEPEVNQKRGATVPARPRN